MSPLRLWPPSHALLRHSGWSLPPLRALDSAFCRPSSTSLASCCPHPHPAKTHIPAGTTLDTVEVESYDPYTDCWTPISPALKYVSNFSAASCQGRLYLVGSSACKYNALALQCYNPITGEQTPAPPCRPVPNRGTGATGPSERLQSYHSGRAQDMGGQVVGSGLPLISYRGSQHH
jgi:hypothetical protein